MPRNLDSTAEIVHFIESNKLRDISKKIVFNASVEFNMYGKTVSKTGQVNIVTGYDVPYKVSILFNDNELKDLPLDFNTTDNSFSNTESRLIIQGHQKNRTPYKVNLVPVK